MNSLLPIPENLMTGEVKDKLQGKIREDGAKRWNEHTRVLPELQKGDFVQMKNLRGRNPLKSDYNGIIVGKNYVNSYSVKVNGSNVVTVRNRASLRKILPPIPVYNLDGMRDIGPVQSVPSAEGAGSRDLARHQAGPPGYIERAGLKSGVRSTDNVVVSGDSTGCRIQKEVEAAEAVLRAGSEMSNPGILRVLRSLPRAGPSAESVLGTGQSSGGPGQGGSRELGSEVGRPAAVGDTPGCGGLRRPDGQDRSDSSQQLLGSSSPVQADGVPVGAEQVPDQFAEVPLPTVRRGSRIKQPVKFYQAGQSGVG